MDDLAGSSFHLPLVLVIGDWDRGEMYSIKVWIQRLGFSACVRHQRTMTPLNDCEEPLPDIVVVCQAWPDEFSAADVSERLGRWPLALWVCCFGVWCESDGRNRAIWPIGIRVPARAAIARLNHLWAIVTGGAQNILPVTASRDEAFDFDVIMTSCFADASSDNQSAEIVVRSPDPALRELLCDLAAKIGATTTRKTVVWDVDPDWERATSQIGAFVASNPGTRVIAIVGLPYPELEIALCAVGVESVVTKAYATSQLVGLVGSGDW